MSALNLFYIAVAVVLGSITPFQAGINATIARHLGHPLWGALTNTTIASLTLLVVIALMRIPAPMLWSAGKAPWWAWIGGVLGSCLVFGSLYFAPRMGAASFVTAAIFGTMTASLIVDHFGLIGYTEQAISPMKLLGAGLVVAGMVIVQTQR